jgi:ribosomal protein L34
MAPRQMKMPAKDNAGKETEQGFSQRMRPESGRYLLHVDRQTKRSYKTAQAAQSAGLEIKSGYPIVQVSIYDSVDNSHTLVKLPATSS